MRNFLLAGIIALFNLRKDEYKYFETNTNATMVFFNINKQHISQTL
jgi:hypothetical protein